MPGTVALVSTIAATLSSSVLGATLIYYGVSAAIYAGLSIGLSLLSNALFKPSSSASRPEDVQQSTRQPLQSRFRHYGKGKYTGPWAFTESKDGGA